jgi:hypothetical protein
MHGTKRCAAACMRRWGCHLVDLCQGARTVLHHRRCATRAHPWKHCALHAFTGCELCMHGVVVC